MRESYFDLKETFEILYVLFILIMPVQVMVSTSIYTITTPDEIWYKYYDFYFSVLVLPGIIYACYDAYYRKIKGIHFERVIALIMIKDLIFLGFAENSIIPYNYSLFLVLITAWSLCYIVHSGLASIEKLERFIDLYFIVAFLSMLLRIFLGLDFQGRYGALGLSVGGTGFFAGIYVLFCIYFKEKNMRTNILCLLALFTLLISGQRTSMIITAFLCIIPTIIRALKVKQKYNGVRVSSLFLNLFYFVSIGIILYGLLLCMGYRVPGYEVLNRMLDSLFISNNLSDESFNGRFMSIEVALEILFDNLIGISNNFYDLQYRMGLLGYPTFPHSTLLACGLLWSPIITAVCFIRLVLYCYQLGKLNSKVFYILLYILIMNIIWGGVFLDYRGLFIQLLFITIAYIDIEKITSLNERNRKNERYSFSRW